MSTARGARATLLGQWIKFLIQFGGFVLLARLIAPDAFGLMAMVAATVGFAALFADLGLSLAGIQAQKLDERDKTALFWMNTIAGTLAASAIVITAPLMVTFYGRPELLSISIFLAVGLLMTGLAVQFRVELVRQGRFATLARQDVAAAGGSLLISGIIAAATQSYWALVAQSVAQSALLLIMAIWRTSWRPTSQIDFQRMRNFARFGGDNLALQLANLASRSIDSMALGRYQSATDLGNYSRASQLISLVFQQIVSPLTRVTLPRLSRAATAADMEFRTLIERLHVAIIYILVGALAMVATFSDSLIPVLLGDEWQTMGDLIRALCAGGAAAAMGYIYYWAALAQKKTGTLLVIELPGRAFMIGGAIIAAPFGVHSVAIVIAIGQWITLIISFFLARRLKIQPGRLLAMSALPGFVFIAALLAAWIPSTSTTETGSRLAAGILVWVAAWLTLLIIPSSRRDLRGIAQLIRGNRP